jgi:hypothetical protein
MGFPFLSTPQVQTAGGRLDGPVFAPVLFEPVVLV